MSISSRSCVVLCSAVLLFSTVVACGSSDASSTSPKPAGTSSTPSAISVFPEKVFVGIDDTGKALGAAPVAVIGASGSVSWSSSDPAIASATGTDKSGKIAPLKKGSSTVSVKEGTKSASVSVTVITYPAADLAKGKAEYTQAGCDGCHASGPDVSPSGLAKHADDEIMAAVTSGKNPEGEEIEGKHTFTATTAIVAYLRSLPARTDTPKKDE